MVEKSAETMQQARIAIRKGQLEEARRLLRQLVRDDPQNYAAWLLLARATPSPSAALEYVKRAESVRPDSLLVQQARTDFEPQNNAVSGRRFKWRTALIAGGFALLLVFTAAAAGSQAWERVASQMNVNVAAAPAAATSTPTVAATIVAELVPAATSALLPTPTIRPTLDPDLIIVDPAEEDAVTNMSEELSGDDAADLVEESIPDDPSRLRPLGVGAQEPWIDVDLNTQLLTAYEGDMPIYSSYISSGTSETPTITGQYRTYVKYETQDMNGYLIGYDYYLQDVPHVMYFYGNFAIHGAYWHNSFGVPTSHGCINVNPVDAGWLYDWAPVGTTVNVHN